MKRTRQEKIQVWKKDPYLSPLLPEILLNSAADNVQDYFLFLEEFKEPYKIIRDGIRNDLMKSNLELIPNLAKKYNFNQKQDIWDMATYFLMAVDNCTIKDEEFKSEFEQSYPELLKSLEKCQRNSIDSKNPMDIALMILVWQCRITLRNSNRYYTVGKLKDLTKRPFILNIFRWTEMFSLLTRGQLLNRMLPTMPHDDNSEARGGVRDATKWFSCQQGHAYAIGDCGQPRQLGKCPCGAPIGNNSISNNFEEKT